MVLDGSTPCIGRMPYVGGHFHPGPDDPEGAWRKPEMDLEGVLECVLSAIRPHATPGARMRRGQATT